MRRRSERKKSLDMCAVIPARRPSRRSKKSPSMEVIDNVDLKSFESSINVEIADILGSSENPIALCESEKIVCTTSTEADKKTYADVSVKSPVENEKGYNLNTSESISVEGSFEMQHGNDIKLQKENFNSCAILDKDVLKANSICEKYGSNVKVKDLVISLDPALNMPSMLVKDEIDSESLISADLSKIRKRKWITKKPIESLFPILSISTDSLRNLISDVQPVPLSDIQLDSSSDVEEVKMDREKSIDIFPKIIKFIDPTEKPYLEKENLMLHRSSSNNFEDVMCTTVRSPSPSKNEESNILYITNLVRPFTILQLKGLLARTGKIVNDGFWIDRIKSKCYVQYEAEEEAIETRHALHGIRWPPSNPKCLNVDFGKKDDMRRAIIMTDNLKKCSEESIQDNSNMCTSFLKNESKIRPVREWDVGKNDNSDGDNKFDIKKNRGNRQKERDLVRGSEGERIDKKQKFRAEACSTSLSPVRKPKTKESDPPLRLLDDLFRKTQTTPCIYWLPLTPEQIAEKEIIRKKRFDEQQNRIMERRKMEKIKAYGREKERNHEQIREREKDQRFDHLNDSRKSQSRDKRRF